MTAVAALSVKIWIDTQGGESGHSHYKSRRCGSEHQK